MAVETSSPPKRNIVAFLIRFAGTLFIIALLAWELFAPRVSPVLPELQAADKALSAKNDKQARRQFEKLIGQGPQEPGIYEAVMSVCLAHGRADLGLEYGQRAIDACKYAPNEARAGLYLALAEVTTLSREAPPRMKSQQYAKRALELAPDDPNALNGYGYILADNARTEQEVNSAFGYIQKALLILRAQSDTPPLTLSQAEDSYGWALYKRGKYKPADYAHAADALHQAVDDLPPETPGELQKQWYYHLGAACRAAGRVEEARHALQVALFYDPKFPEALREFHALPPASHAPNSPAPAAPPVSTQTADGKPIFQPLSEKK